VVVLFEAIDYVPKCAAVVWTESGICGGISLH